MKREIALYIHIPFCKQKCFYCDFPSFSNKEGLMDEYIDALIKEIGLRTKDYTIKTIFIGGGTPSYLDFKNMKKLLEAINKLELKEELEFTMECNPGTLEDEKLMLMKTMGINRISMGLQTTHNNLLKSIGRIHSFEEFKDNFNKARSIGFDNINIDLMFGLPNQSVAEWKESLTEIAKLRPEHISAYSLIVEEGTAFYKLYENNKLILPNEDDERIMYNFTLNILKKYGYNQYEISNFSFEGKECKHNVVYWDLDDYLGLGSSSSSYIDGIRYKNVEDIEEYIMNVKYNDTAIIETYKNTMEDNMSEFVFMNLRKMSGFSKNRFKERFNKDVYSVYGEAILKHKNNGLIIDDQYNIYLSSKGIEVSNYVMADFV